MLPPDDLDRELARLLAVDGRTSATSLARTLDVPASTLHRRLQKLLTNRQIELRCDVAPELGGWSLECTWTATIPLNHKTRVLELLRQRLRFPPERRGIHNEDRDAREAQEVRPGVP